MTTLNYLRRSTVRALKHRQFTSRGFSGSSAIREKSSFEPKKILIVSKLSRYHYEKLQEPNWGEEEFRNKLIEKGSDYETLRASHDATEAVKNEVIQLFRKLDVEYKVVDRTTVSVQSFDWADLVLPIGGDGTFLLASNMIYDNAKPIMGINSYPQKSRGYLMLSPKYTKNIPQIFEMLKTGNFNILMRRRIRTTLKGDQIHCAPFHMHQKAGCIPGIERFYEDTGGENSLMREIRLPWLALNEVFIGEALAAKTSTLLIKVDDYEKSHKVKSSGLCVSTGTGSTSWYKAINSITPQTVREILNLVDRTTNLSDEQVEGICATFNNKLQFDPEDPKLGYALRETIITHAQSIPEDLHRDFCKKLTVRSQCNDGAMVIDSGVAIPFNIGDTAVLESHSEDSLKCITLPQ